MRFSWEKGICRKSEIIRAGRKLFQKELDFPLSFSPPDGSEELNSAFPLKKLEEDLWSNRKENLVRNELAPLS